jgi:Bacterial Ig-like domain
MMRFVTVIIIALLGGRFSLAFEPPKVVSTSPKFWEIGVSPSRQSAIAVTFNQIMRSGFWDFLGNDTLSPQTNYETTMGSDLKSFSLRVTLHPGKVYIMGLNERGIPGVGFQNDKGISLKPTYLVFQTAGNPSQQNAPPRALSTFPGNGARDVNPAAIKAITVSFDRAMETKKHGLHLFEEKQPVDLTGATFNYSTDGKTFSLTYAFKSSTHYEVQMNSTEDIGFAATNRAPLWPVHFAFTTGQPH